MILKGFTRVALYLFPVSLVIGLILNEYDLTELWDIYIKLLLWLSFVVFLTGLGFEFHNWLLEQKIEQKRRNE